MDRLKARKLLGVLLCISAIAGGVMAWEWAGSGGEIATDNAYVRGDITALAPRVGGFVSAVEIGDNQAVRAGDVLLRIDDRDYRARLAQAVANVEAAEARLANADADAVLQQAMIRQAEAQRQAALADLELARKESGRRRELILTNAVSQARVDESETSRMRAEAGLAAAGATLDAQHQRIKVLDSQRRAAKAAVAQAKAAKELAAIDLENTVLRAPVSGVVGNRQVRLGRLVAPGTPLLDIVPVDDVWLVANFKETQVRTIRPGQPVRILIDGYSDRSFQGVVDSLAPGSGSAFSMLPPDNATGNFIRVVQRVPVKIRLLNNPLPGRIVPGLSARVTIEPGAGEPGAGS